MIVRSENRVSTAEATRGGLDRQCRARLTAQLAELRRRHHAEFSQLREALASADGELLELRRRHARGAAP
jgi:hypothetical protein